LERAIGVRVLCVLLSGSICLRNIGWIRFTFQDFADDDVRQWIRSFGSLGAAAAPTVGGSDNYGCFAVGGGIALPWVASATLVEMAWGRSYSLFLVHYGVNHVVLFLLNPRASTGPVAAFVGMWIAFAASLAMSDLFWRRVEVPSQRLSKRLQSQWSQHSKRPAVGWLHRWQARRGVSAEPKIS